MHLVLLLLHQIKNLLWPLRPTLVTSIVAIIFFTILAIGLPSYFSIRTAVDALWENTAEQIAASTKEVSSRYLSTAKPAAAILRDLSLQGTLDLKNKKQLLEFTRAIMESYQDFTWVAFASIYGDYTAAYTLPNDPFIHGTNSTIEKQESLKAPVTKDGEYLWNGTSWSLKNDIIDDYDPRKRPFWKTGIGIENGSWSEPFIEWETKLPSFSYTLIQRNIIGLLEGLWEIEFRSDYLSEFLSSIEIGKSGSIWILSDKGTVIASSKSSSSNIISASDPQKADPLLFTAWEHLQIQGERKKSFSFGDYLGYVEELTTSSNLSWKILIILPKSEFLGPIKHLSWALTISCLLLCSLFSYLGSLFFGRISTNLIEIAYEIEKIGELTFSNEVFSNKISSIQEIKMMNTSTDLLKTSLGSFAKYVPLDIIHSLMQSGKAAELGGRKNEMTVLFSNLINFNELAKQLPQIRFLEILSDYFTAMSLIIQKNHGQVDKFMGYSMMAFWNAPKEYKEHARAACSTALLMRSALEELSARWKVSHIPSVFQHIGINTGTMIVGNIGSPTRMQYTVIGDAVNLGSRLAGLNKFYNTQILASEATMNQAGSEFVFRPLDFVYVKGRSQISLVYELLGSAEINSPELQQAISTYEQALYLYSNREFIKAAQKFEVALEHFKGTDSPSILMAKRSRSYLLHPPPDDWAGALLMEQK
ncbi:MAG: hypothetical protein NTY13_06150 [Chlamydiae bacterium]|nr:hypothetical protein [Chlamydiota bacterium]